MLHRQLLWPLCLLLGWSAASAQAALLEYEGFDYPGALGTSLNGLNGGFGWSGNAWSDPDLDMTLAASNTSLTFPAGVSASPTGGSVALASADSSVQAVRALGTPLNLATSGQTYYASALFRTSAITGQTATVDFFDTTGGTGNLRWSFGITSAGNFRVGVDPNNVDQRADSAFTLTPNTTYFLVAKFRTNTFPANTNDEVFLKIYDPDDFVGAEPLTDLDWDLRANGGSGVTLRSIRLTMANGAGQTNFFDEFRVGTSFAEVVPEPGTISLLSAGILGIAYGWRRKMGRDRQ